MQISITGPPGVVNERFEKLAKRQLIRAFGNYSGSILSIEAEISEELKQHKPRQHCRMTVNMLGLVLVTSEAWDENTLAALVRAADRGRQKMMAQIYRPRRQTV